MNGLDVLRKMKLDTRVNQKTGLVEVTVEGKTILSFGTEAAVYLTAKLTLAIHEAKAFAGATGTDIIMLGRLTDAETELKKEQKRRF